MKYLKQIIVRGKKMTLPIYCPDATRAVVRTLDGDDLKKIGIEGLILNPYHLLSQPGLKIIKKAGGVKNYMNWSGFAISDSGGWQLLSLVYKDPSFGKITDLGVVFYKGSRGEKRKIVFTPEKSIQVQFDLKTDIIICLDDCPGRNASKKENEISVERTIAWAKRCKAEYLKQLSKLSRLTPGVRTPGGSGGSKNRPLLLAVVQGGHSKKLRERCAEELLKIGFDGYGLGGWLTDKNGKINLGLIGFISKILPDNLPKFALGVGYPKDIIDLTKLGYHIFDCVLPTRDARHKRLYVWKKDPQKINNIFKTKNIFGYFYPDKEKYSLDLKPVDKFCDCPLCKNHSRAYLWHLFKIQDALAWRLATLHNLRVYAKLIEILRKTLQSN